MSVHTTKVELDSCLRSLNFVQQSPAALATNETRLDVSEWRKLRSSLHQIDCLDGKVIRPKPQRVSAIAIAALDVLKPLRQWKSSSTSQSSVDKETNDEILDIFLSKNTCCDIGRSPPYFCGSPPGRVGNPHVRDVNFLHQNLHVRDMKSLHQNQLAKDMKFPKWSPLTGDIKLSLKPVAAASSPRASPRVRVEGFDCSSHMVEYTSRDSRCHVSAFV